MKQTSKARLIRAAQFFRENPEGEISTGLWQEPYWNRSSFNRWFVGCLNDKINSKDPRFPKGRKTNPEFEMELSRNAPFLRCRAIIDYIPPILKLDRRIYAALAKRLRCNFE